MQVYAFISAIFLSVLGSAITMVAIPWFLLEYTNDIAYTSGVLAIRVLPIVISTLSGSWILDKYSKRSICMVSDVLSGIAILMIPLLFEAELLSIVPLVILITVSAVLEPISGASVTAMVPDMLEHSSMERERLNGIIGSLHNFGDLAGPIMGGFIVAFYGTSVALGIDALTFMASAMIFLFFIRPHKAVEAPGEVAGIDNDNIAAGFRFIVSQYCIIFVAILSVVVNLLIVPLLVLILPFIAKTQLGSAISFGFLVSVFGAGAFAASLLFTAFGHRVEKLSLIFLCNTMLLLGFLVASIALDVYTLSTVLFFIGLSVGFFGPLDDTLLQLFTPSSLRGRVFLAYSAIRYITVPVSMVVFGLLLDSISLSAIFMSMALCLLATMVWLFTNRKKFIGESERLIADAELSGAQ